MIISNIIGGLGNQMFQYACGRAASIRLNLPYKVATDQYKNYHLHNGLEFNDVFHIPIQIADKKDIETFFGWKTPALLRRSFYRLNMMWLLGDNCYTESSFISPDDIKGITGPSYFHGYWQSENYFNDVEDFIRKDFTFALPWSSTDLSIRDRMKASPSLSVHVRRGDYMAKKNKNIYAYLDMNYYRKAIKYVQERVPGINLFIFSDDPYWIRANFNGTCGEYELISHNTGLGSSNDMRLMSQASHHIIANSSFSWWGAWLNSSKDKIVIAPQNWFCKETSDTNLIPSAWVRI